jgi:hypothetical protein
MAPSYPGEIHNQRGTRVRKDRIEHLVFTIEKLISIGMKPYKLIVCYRLVVDMRPPRQLFFVINDLSSKSATWQYYGTIPL